MVFLFSFNSIIDSYHLGSTVVRRRNVSSLSDPILNRGHRNDLHREMLLPARVAGNYRNYDVCEFENGKSFWLIYSTA